MIGGAINVQSSTHQSIILGHQMVSYIVLSHGLFNIDSLKESCNMPKPVTWDEGKHFLSLLHPGCKMTYGDWWIEVRICPAIPIIDHASCI